MDPRTDRPTSASSPRGALPQRTTNNSYKARHGMHPPRLTGPDRAGADIGLEILISKAGPKRVLSESRRRKWRSCFGDRRNQKDAVVLARGEQTGAPARGQQCCRMHPDPATPARSLAGDVTSPIGQPQRRDGPTPAWLLSAAGGNAEPAQAAMRKVGVFDHADEVEGTIEFMRGVRREVARIE